LDILPLCFGLRKPWAASAGSKEGDEGAAHQAAHSFVTTGLDPVVHAEMQLFKTHGEAERAALPHGLPG